MKLTMPFHDDNVLTWDAAHRQKCRAYRGALNMQTLRERGTDDDLSTPSMQGQCSIKCRSTHFPSDLSELLKNGETLIPTTIISM